MKKAILLVLALCLTLLASESFAEQPMKWKGSGGWGVGTQYGRMYNPQTVVTVGGVVEKVELITPMKGMSYGVHLDLKTEKEVIDVHLGPDWYLENQDVKIMPGDKVEIVGSRITIQDKPVVIAASVKKGEELLKLRDENGLPAWAGWRRR